MIHTSHRYNVINESLYGFSDVKLQNKEYKDIHNGFKGLGYRYLGMLCFTTGKDYNTLCPEELEEAIQTTLWDMEKEIFGKYITFCHLDVFYAYRKDEVAPEIYDFNKRENICKIKYYKDKKLLYCFWNPVEKYYYFIKMRNLYGGATSVYTNDKKLLEKWIALKHDGIEAVRNDYIRLKKEYDELQEKLRLEREEKERKEAYLKSLKQQVKDIETKILKDAGKNPDKYQEFKSIWDIPENILSKDVKKKLFHSEYTPEEQLKIGWFEVKGEALTSKDPYDRCTHMFYVADKDMKYRFKYRCEVNYARAGTYWGD